VPGRVGFSLDVRAYDEADLAELQREMDGLVGGIQANRGVRFSYGTRTTARVARADAAISQELASIAQEHGIRAQDLPSPASHDAAVFRSAGVAMGLLLIRNRNGSHNPDEAMDMDDFMAAAGVLTHWLLERAAAN
jgi:N-carbamoyl-L-amino-acid hydrolase